MAVISAVFVQGNTGPDIVGQLHSATDATVPIDLDRCSVKFQMRKPDDTMFTVDSAARITNSSQGLVAYTWGANDLSVPGEYDVQWEVTFPDYKVQTNSEPNRILVRRR